MAAPPSFISITRAQQNSTLEALGASNPAYLESLIDAASATIRQYCTSDIYNPGYTYSQYVDGGVYSNTNPLIFRQKPVTQILRIAACPQPVLFVTNSGATAQRATVATDNSSPINILLAWVESGVPGGVTIPTTGSNITIQGLANAINAVGHGFSTLPSGGFTLYPSQDLRPLTGAVSALSGGASLELWTEELQPYQGWYDPDGYVWQTGWRLDRETGMCYGCFPRGTQNVWVQYQAGLASVPQDLQEACVQLAQWLYNSSQSNAVIKSEKLGNQSYELNPHATIPIGIRQMLYPYQDHARVMSW